MRLTLHIGFEKTATTTIQHYLYHNRAVLAARGVALSDVLGAPNNRKLAAFCQNPDSHRDNFFRRNNLRTAADHARFFQGFEAEFAAEVSAAAASGADHFVISAEHLHSRLTDHAAVMRLRDVLAPLFSDIRVLAWVREQSAVARSLYSTALRGGGTAGIETFVARCTPDNRRYNYLTSADLWAGVFGADAIGLRVFDRGAFHGGTICTDVLHALGVADTGFATLEQDRNESLSMTAAALYRTLNGQVARFHRDGAPNPVYRALSNAIETAAPASGSGMAFDGAAQIYDQFDAVNRTFAARYMGRDDSPFAPPSSGPISGPISGLGAPTDPDPQAQAHEADLLAFWQALLGGLGDLAVLSRPEAAQLRRIARGIRSGQADIGKQEAAMLSGLANRLRGSEGTRDG